MQHRNNKKAIIGALCAVIIGLAVGYAALSQILTITGTSGITGDFKIEFTKIDEGTMSGATTVLKGGVGSTTANFTVDLKKPGSSAIYDLTVENKGTIDAILTSIEGIDESNLSEPLDIKYSLIGIDEGESLNAGATKSFQVKVVWDSSATSVPSKSKNLVLKLNYEQDTGSSIVTTPEEFFEIDESGTVKKYTGTDTDIVIPKTIGGIRVTQIGENAFYNSQVTSVVIPQGVTRIDNYAFMNSQLTNVEMPNSVTSIGHGAFTRSQLTSVVIPSSVTTIEDNTFSDNQLTDIVIPEGVTSIGFGSFSGNRLTSVVISDTVTSIVDNAFRGNQLTNVIIPKNVTSIGENVFAANTSLTTIVNKTGNPFDWAKITGQGSGTPAVTGTYGSINVIAE